MLTLPLLDLISKMKLARNCRQQPAHCSKRVIQLSTGHVLSSLAKLAIWFARAIATALRIALHDNTIPAAICFFIHSASLAPSPSLCPSFYLSLSFQKLAFPHKLAGQSKPTS